MCFGTISEWHGKFTEILVCAVTSVVGLFVWFAHFFVHLLDSASAFLSSEEGPSALEVDQGELHNQTEDPSDKSKARARQDLPSSYCAGGEPGLSKEATENLPV